LKTQGTQAAVGDGGREGGRSRTSSRVILSAIWIDLLLRKKAKKPNIPIDPSGSQLENRMLFIVVVLGRGLRGLAEDFG